MLNVAVVDDEEKERAHLSRLLTRYAQAKGEKFRTVPFESGVQFLTGYQADSFDMVFMDVDKIGRASCRERV